MISIAIVRAEPPADPEFAPRRDALRLTDRQRALVEHFAVTHVKAASRPTFHLALLSKLAGGCCGDAALRRAIALAALDIGVEPDLLHRVGLLMRGETGLARHDPKTGDSDADE